MSCIGIDDVSQTNNLFVYVSLYYHMLKIAEQLIQYLRKLGMLDFFLIFAIV
jgi:hypothetical protein